MAFTNTGNDLAPSCGGIGAGTSLVRLGRVALTAPAGTDFVQLRAFMLDATKVIVGAPVFLVGVIHLRTDAS